VRLIAVNDNYDSYYGEDDFIPFRNIMNEWYAKDTSKKIRSTFKASILLLCPFRLLPVRLFLMIQLWVSKYVGLAENIILCYGEKV
jgi:hypothetical protein